MYSELTGLQNSIITITFLGVEHNYYRGEENKLSTT